MHDWGGAIDVVGWSCVVSFRLCVNGSSTILQGNVLAHESSSKLEPVGVVNYVITDGVGESGFADSLGPLC